MAPPIWLDDTGRCAIAALLHAEVSPGMPVRRYRFEHLYLIGWAKPRQVLKIVN
jgi:hypothetical protein